MQHFGPQERSIFFVGLKRRTTRANHVTKMEHPNPYNHLATICKAVIGLATFSTRIVIYLILIRCAGTSP